MLALDLEVVGEEPREVGEVMQRRAAHAPARLVDKTEWVLAFEQERTARGLDPPPPELRADEIGELPVRPLLQKHDLLACLGQDRGEDRPGRAGADDDDVYFFVGHVTTSWSARCGACRGCRGWHSLPWCRRRRRRHRCAAPDRRMVRGALASLGSCAGACRRRGCAAPPA